MSDSSNDSRLVMAQRLKLLLIARATGRAALGNDAEYQQVRRRLMASSILHQLPDILVTYRTLDEFWIFIQPEFKSYDERRTYIRDQFASLLQNLEAGNEKTEGTLRSETVLSRSGSDGSNMPHSDGKLTHSTPDTKTVFVVFGRNMAARDELFAFLRALHLRPLEWSQIVRLTGKASPYVGEVLDAGFASARAVIVLLTPDDEARLRSAYHLPSDETYETRIARQPRQNVLFEAGMAMGKDASRTIIVEMGKLRPMSDMIGRHSIRLNSTAERRNELASRLESAGCEIDRTGGDWLRVGRFDEVLAAISDDNGDEAINVVASSVLLSADEQNYLLDISRPRNETAFSVSYMRSLTGKEVSYLEMMERLVEFGIMREGMDVFSLTTEGRKVTDALWRERILRALSRISNDGRGLDELGEDVVLNDGESETAELRRHLESLQDDELVTMEEISLDGMLDIRITSEGRKALMVK